MYIIIQYNTIQKKHVHGRHRCSAGCALSSSLRISGPAPNTRLTLRFAWRAGSHCADCCVLRGRKSGRAEVAVDTHLFHNWRPRVRVYTLTDPTHNPPNKFNYCDHIFATEGLLAKFAKIKTA